MDIHKLRCILSLAELKNVTKAAKQNFIAQSTMSETISAVEAEIGVQLFERSNRAVLPTAAGERFAAAAELIVRDYDVAVAEARRIAEGSASYVTIGFNSVNIGERLDVIAGWIDSRCPDVSLLFCKHAISELTQCLVDGRASIVISNQFEARKIPTARSLTIAQTRPCIYVPKGHRLAGKSEVVVDDLSGERLLCACSEDRPGKISAAAEVLRDGGVPYTSDSLVSSEDAIVSMVEAGIGLYPASDWYCRALGERVECVPLSLEVEIMQIVVMWLDESVSGVAHELATIMRSIFSKKN